MPKLWNETIETHRRAVRDATLDATAALVAEQGLASVTMSAIAQATGIGRATLYKYFPDVDAILGAWHERHIAGHLAHLQHVRDHLGAAGGLEAVLEAYAQMSQAHEGGELASLLHQGAHVAHARLHLSGFLRDLLAEGAARGEIRADVAPDELALYCLHALSAAGVLQSKVAIRRLVVVTMAGLRPPS